MKNFRFVIHSLTSLILFTALSCTTKKDGTAYRIYHNTTAHYNGFFNAGESVKKGLAKITAAHKEDYDAILPVFIIGNEETAKASYPEMEKAIEKCTKVVSRHTITAQSKNERKHPGYNKWIDDNYMVIGQAYFYKRNYLKAQETFQFVSRKYKDLDTQASANTWLARALIEDGDYSKALQTLNRVEIERKEVSDENKAQFYMVMADLYIRQAKYEQAAAQMKLALKHIKHKKDRARPHFILAQLYQQLNQSSNAQAEYDAVVASKPPYELEFYAKINKALSFSRLGGNAAEIKKELMKMLKDEKNESYRDQIYYALGDISLEEQDRDLAIYYFQESLKANKDNVKQKAKTFLRLADLNFEQRSYENAQLYYDSTFKNIDEKHVRYKEIKARAESLNELVGYLNLIELNDSMLVLCGKSDAEIEKSLQQAVAQKQAEMDRKRADDEAKAAAAQEGAEEGVSGSFFAYNSNLRDKGKENFKETWGDRPLKDNWRLQSRLATSFGTPDESVVAVESTQDSTATQNTDAYKVPTVDDLRAQLPCGDEQKMMASAASTAEAYYKAGVLYKESLDDDDNAISSWEQLISNIEESDYHPLSVYQLFRTWLSKEQLDGYKRNPFCSTCDSKYWAEEVKRRYPGSEWARLVDNPEYVDIRELTEAKEREEYQKAYIKYTERNYVEAIAMCNQVITNEPNNHLLCKYKLLRAVSTGYTDAQYSMKENYLRELNEVKTTCAGTEEAQRAQELINAADPQANTVENTDKPKEGGQTASDKPAVEYKYDEGAEHYFAIIIPVQGSNINTTKASIGDFNTTFYSTAELKVTNNLLDKTQHIVLVKPFKTIPEAKDYMNTFMSDQTKLQEINNAGGARFLISKQNYIALFKNKDLAGYILFYEENYK